MSVRMRRVGVEQEIEVPEISVTHYERSGWQVVDGQPGMTTAAAKGRRRTEKEQD
ncbi:hypothetical protein [Streptomyces sp. ML-6]|uniref:hypothetical protein n=1 Tax=Streptomyces sp. ML-6 TaxID=2982693 RepID=UPI0024C0D3FE|nr:hypothetical protein [Streptomyces sp. ML-6]MDK0520389.1 hypothetical protein [Streptomyces sp. ML-6]